MDELGILYVREVRGLLNFPSKLEIPVFHGLTGRLPHEGLKLNERDLIIHFYNIFVSASEKLLRKPVRYRVNVLYHLLKKIVKKPNADQFPFMKGDSHQCTEEEIELALNI